MVGYQEINTELADFVILLATTSSPCLGCAFNHPTEK